MPTTTTTITATMATPSQIPVSTIAVSVELAENIIEILDEYRRTLKKKASRAASELEIIEDQEAAARSHDEMAMLRDYADKISDKYNDIKDDQSRIKRIIKLLATTKMEFKLPK